jgi:hypothetical protein
MNRRHQLGKAKYGATSRSLLHWLPWRKTSLLLSKAAGQRALCVHEKNYTSPRTKMHHFPHVTYSYLLMDQGSISQ